MRAPRLRAASTYSRCDTLSVWARTIREIGAIDSTANTKVIAQALVTQPKPNAEDLDVALLQGPGPADDEGGEDQRGEGQQGVDEDRDHAVGPAPAVAGEHAERRAHAAPMTMLATAMISEMRAP